MLRSHQSLLAETLREVRGRRAEEVEHDFYLCPYPALGVSPGGGCRSDFRRVSPVQQCVYGYKGGVKACVAGRGGAPAAEG